MGAWFWSHTPSCSVPCSAPGRPRSAPQTGCAAMGWMGRCPGEAARCDSNEVDWYCGAYLNVYTWINTHKYTISVEQMHAYVWSALTPRLFSLKGERGQPLIMAGPQGKYTCTSLFTQGATTFKTNRSPLWEQFKSWNYAVKGCPPVAGHFL